MKLTSFISTLGLACLGGAAVVPQAYAAEPAPGVYLGGGLSYSGVSGLGGKIDGATPNQGLGTTSSADSTSTNGNLRLGYRINPRVAVEATYDQVGNMNVQSAVTAPGADTAKGTWKSSGLGLHVIGNLPLNDKWSVYGRVGAEQWNTSLSLASTTGGATALSTSSNNTALALGAGAAYALTRNLDATAEYMHYSRVGDDTSTGSTGLDRVNVGLLYHFR
jgi:opacity protein-like surface antigen